MTADVAFGLLTLDGQDGGFVRVDSSLSSILQTIPQSESAFTSTGLHMASVTDPAWSSGSANDRYVLALTAYRTAGHSSQEITLQLNESDDFTDGPWGNVVGGGLGLMSSNF